MPLRFSLFWVFQLATTREPAAAAVLCLHEPNSESTIIPAVAKRLKQTLLPQILAVPDRRQWDGAVLGAKRPCTQGWRKAALPPHSRAVLLLD